MKIIMADKKKISADTSAAPDSGTGLGVWALAAIVVSSMIGGGIYSLPQMPIRSSTESLHCLSD